MSGFTDSESQRSGRSGKRPTDVHAWVHWNGGSGAPETQYNISSISNPETGQWMVYFRKASPTSNHCCHVTTGGGGYDGDCWTGDYAAGAVRVLQANGGAYSNTTEMNLTVFTP